MTIKHRASRPEKLMRLASRLLSVLLLSAAPLALADDAGSDQTRIDFNIPVQTVPTALSEFARQARVQLFFISDGYEDVRANAVFGTYTRQGALDLLLGGTGLKASISPHSGIEVKPVSSTMSLRSGESRLSAAVREVAVADGAGGSRDPGGLQAGGGREFDDVEREKRPIEEIVVTGTNILGIAPESSPVRTFTREDIQISGAGTAQDFIDKLPANFGGGSNIDTPAGLPNDSNSTFNAAFRGGLGSSVNLRGLGSGSTLVLLNGHRMAPSSGLGNFVDTSMIPASALERIEILYDGASSIYGGEAIAGVVNFVLRDDFDGVETSLRHGTVTEGKLNEYRASVTAGRSWEAGNALVVYEFFSQTDLSAADRSFSQDALLPNDLLPSQRRYSALASGSQELTPNFEVFADLSFSNREVRSDSNSEGFIFSSFSPSKTFNVSSGASWNVSETWILDVVGTYSALDNDPELLGDIFQGLRHIDFDLWSVDAKATGPLFSLPGGDVKTAFGGHYRTESFTNLNALSALGNRDAVRDVYAIFGEVFIPIIGPDNASPGIQRLEVNLSGRVEDYSDFGTTANPKVGVIWAPHEALRLRASYGTSFKPPPLGRVGASDFAGSVRLTSNLNSRFGLTPGDPSIADVVVISVFGTDKELDPETSHALTAGLDFTKDYGNNGLSCSITWFDIDFENRLGTTPCPLCTNGTPFDAPNIAFNSPEFFPTGTIIFFPSQVQINELLDSFDRVNAFPDGTDPLGAAIINFSGVTRNLARTKVSGIDFDLTYAIESQIGDFSIGLNGTYLTTFSQQPAMTTPLLEVVDTLHNPIDLRIRGSAGYTNKGFAAKLFVNYADKYNSDTTSEALPIDSWTTLDLALSYDRKKDFNSSILDDTTLRLSVLNLFDQDPPSTPSNPGFLVFGYDPANASPLGRFVAFEITKRW